MNSTRFCLAVLAAVLQSVAFGNPGARQPASTRPVVTGPDSPQASAASRDPRVEAIFQKLWENWDREGKYVRDKWDREGKYARDKWERMTTIEKAQLINKWAAQGTLKGANWKPSEEEAARFVSEQLTDREFTQQPRIEQLLDWIRSNLTNEERSQFLTQEKSLIGELAALGTPAVDALLARVQEPYQEKPAGRQARWAAEALGKMGDPALPAIANELDRCMGADPASSVYNISAYKAQLLVEALAANPFPAAVPVLHRMLDYPVPLAAGTALVALAKIPGGLTQELLLQLYENNPDLRAHAARLLGERGDEKAIELLERDIPTAYAQARYEAQDAVWQIKSRLGLEAGRHPEAPHRLGKTKTWQDDEPLWQGFEESLKSPNKAIRLEALGHLKILANEQADYLQTLVAVARTDPDRGVRIKATEHLAHAFYSQVNGRNNEGKTLEPLNSIFDDLAQIVIRGDDDFVTAVLVMPPHLLQRFNSRPACQGMVARILDGVASTKIACRAACLTAFAFLGEADADVAKLGKTPERKRTMSAAVLAGLTSDYGRYKVDAIETAGMLALTEAVPGLIAIASTAREFNYRMSTVISLGQIGDPRALDALQQIADADPYVDSNGVYRNREEAQKAIQAIRARHATSPSESSEKESSALQSKTQR